MPPLRTPHRGPGIDPQGAGTRSPGAVGQGAASKAEATKEATSKVEASSVADYERLHTEVLSRLPSVTRIQSSFAIRNVLRPVRH